MHNSIDSHVTSLPMQVPLHGSGSDKSRSAGSEVAARAAQKLDELQRLLELAEHDDPYEVAPLTYRLPPGFVLSIVVPVYNEEATILTLLGRVASLPLPKEIIVVDDHSGDGTPQLLEPLREVPGMRVLSKPRNEGKGAALRDGFAASRGDIVIVQDADLEYDPRDIPPLLEPILTGTADAVYGSRFLHERPQDPSLLHRLGNGLLTRTSNLLTGLQLTDMETCYKAFRGDVIRELPISQDRFGFEPEVTAKLARRGYRIVELPISYHARSYEEGKKIGVRDAVNAFYCMVRYAALD